MHRIWAKCYYGTPAELALEPHVAALGIPYRTQYPMFLWGGRYFPDFALPTIGWIIEVDDPSHDTDEKRKTDDERTAALEAKGWRVLRCTNEQALTTPTSVIASLQSAREQRGDVYIGLPPSRKEKENNVIRTSVSSSGRIGSRRRRSA